MALQNKLQESIKRGAVADFSAFSGFREKNKQMIKEEVEKFKQEALQELKTILQEAVGEDRAFAIRGERAQAPLKLIDN